MAFTNEPTSGSASASFIYMKIAGLLAELK